MNNPRIGIGLQSRLNSQRLPSKALLPLGSSLVLNHGMRRLKYLAVSAYGLLTDEPSAPRFEPLAQHEGFDCIPGDSEDVLDRYYRFSKTYDLDLIIRATGDNPLVFVSYVPDFLNHLLSLDRLPDYATLKGLPYGAGLEFIKSEALETAWKKSTAQSHREHVCPFLYENPRDFFIYHLDAPNHLRAEHLRITLDTLEDYHFLQQLFLHTEIELPGTDQLVIHYAQSMGQRSLVADGGIHGTPR